MLNQKGNFLIIIGVLVLIVIVGATSYYLGSQKYSPPQAENTQVDASPLIKTQTVAVSASPAVLGVIPNDWTLESGRYCNFKFYLPPNRAPYFELLDPNSTDPINRRFWQIRDFSDSKVSSVSIMHVADVEASGFISGAIGIGCSKNTNSKTADQRVMEYAAEMENPETGGGLKEKRNDVMWGFPVIIAKFFGGASDPNQEHYFFTTKDYNYLITKQSDSKDIKVKDTTDLIFNNLQFTD